MSTIETRFSRMQKLAEGDCEEAAEVLWQFYYDESLTAKEYNGIIEYAKIVRHDWREFIEED